jgi:hypothetical protein
VSEWLSEWVNDACRVSMCLTKKKVEYSNISIFQYFERKFPFFVFCGIWFQVLSIKNVGITVQNLCALLQ